ncbi:type II toxin-antitoxin system ParD family antitoxin [Sphaerotilus microaerophilus]|nr:type II toxin-antitoxin system ParD family antitoxin [Sphaerotilus sp. FB-5]
MQGSAMTMHINLSPEMEIFIKGKVAGGFYGNATEVIRDAIRRMQAEDDRTRAWLAAIRAGDVELERGEGIPYTAKALDAITKAALAGMNSGQPMEPDVLP